MAVRWTQPKMREVALEERAELGLGPLEPLDPYQLAEQHGISVFPITALTDEAAAAAAAEYFTTVRPSTWSAALIPVGSARIIIENDSHPVPRRRSSIAHELGHFLLEHIFDNVLLTDDGCRRFDRTKEDQAKFISGELLVPWEAAKKAAFRELTNEQIADRFGVSTQFAQMRMAGARVMAQRALAKQARYR